MQLNGTDIVDRHNRPTVLQRVGLRVFFINDGEYFDPYDISGVTVFAKASNFSPSSVFTNNVISSSIPSSIILAQFGASANDSGAALAPTSYNPLNSASLSGIYRVKKGEYVVVLDGTQTQNGLYSFYGSSIVITNGASSVQDYIDVWTIKFAESSNWTSLINEFTLYDDTLFTVTQPLIFTASNRLINKTVRLGSVETLKIKTDITVENSKVDESIKNIFKDSVITSAMVTIEKINENSPNLNYSVNVSGYSDTSSLVDITADNTILLSFNTNLLLNHPNVALFGGIVGPYRLTAKYQILNDTIVTQPFYFIIS